MLFFGQRDLGLRTSVRLMFIWKQSTSLSIANWSANSPPRECKHHSYWAGKTTLIATVITTTTEFTWVQWETLLSLWVYSCKLMQTTPDDIEDRRLCGLFVSFQNNGIASDTHREITKSKLCNLILNIPGQYRLVMKKGHPIGGTWLSRNRYIVW